MSRVEEIERILEQLPADDFEKLSLWVEQWRGKIALYPEPKPQTMEVRDQQAFLNGYSPEDEGIYDDAVRARFSMAEPCQKLAGG